MIPCSYVELKDWFKIQKLPYKKEAKWTVARERSIEHAVEMSFKKSIGKKFKSKSRAS